MSLDLVLYKDLNELLHAYADRQGITFGTLAKSIDRSADALRSWSKGRKISRDKIIELSKETQIPAEVIIRIQFYPTLYSFETRRMSTCPYEDNIVEPSVLKGKFATTKERYDELSSFAEIKPLKASETDVEHVKAYIRQMYEEELLPDKWEDAIDTSIRIIGGMNVIIKDPFTKHHTGHIVTIPLPGNIDIKEVNNEKSLLADNPLKEAGFSSKPTTFHVFSFWAVNSTYAYMLLQEAIEYLLGNIQDETILTKAGDTESWVTGFPTTPDARIMCRALGMKPVGRQETLNKRRGRQIPSGLWGRELSDIVKLFNRATRAWN